MSLVTTSFDSTSGQTQGGTTLRSSRGLALRGLRSIRRLPSAFFPALAMPIFQTIAFSGTFFAITKIPGFPTDRSVNWYLPFACCMGSGFSGVGLGFTTVRDIESGFFDRLRMAPSPRLSLIIGPLFTAWIREALLVDGFLPARLRAPGTDWSHQWFWDGHEHVDPAKEAAAQAQRLASNTTTLADEFARKGQDWEVQLRQRAREVALMQELGLPLTTAVGSGAPAPAREKPGPSDTTDPANPDAGDEIDARAA